MKQTARRRLILQEHNLLGSPLAVQAAFWQHYNRKPHAWRAAASLGDIAGKLLEDGSLRASRMLDQVARVWHESLPPEYRSATRVEGFQSGRLRVIVDGAATRFVFLRQFGQVLIDAMNRRFGKPLIKRIDYRIGSVQAKG